MATLFGLLIFVAWTDISHAYSVFGYSDTISDSHPGNEANHTVGFTITKNVSPGAYIDIIPPTGFEILSTSTFDVRNVELVVNGTPRVASSTMSPGVDRVQITTGNPGLIRYTLNPSSGLSAYDELELLIGNHTSNSRSFSISYSTTTGTTTVQSDIEPVVNSSLTGVHKMKIRVYDGGLIATADPIIFLIKNISVGPVDTTETVPPYRFNGAPTSSVGGTTLSVEISLETDELAICRFSTVAGTAYGSMPNTFSDTGLIVHKHVVAVVPESIQRFYVRCIDDEGNINIDDYLITFTVDEVPSGTANEEGSTSGDGSGSGNTGTGTGTGGGGTQGSSDGNTPEYGGQTGGGGSGGGGGGSSGDDDEDDSGGGFELSDAPYESGDGEVIINGYAFPGSTVVILVDGVAADTDTANDDGKYSITLSEIARGVYTFGVYAIDKRNVKSSTFSTSFTVTGSRTTSLSNINVMPSILVQPDPVDVGQTLTISGYTLPNANLNIENQKDKVAQSLQKLEAVSDSKGLWSITLDTSRFSKGTYKVRASASQSGGPSTNFSNYTFYGVGESATRPLNPDLNRDGSVNLIDFSILLFWWGSDGGESDPPADINQDGSVSLTDFSILLFNWTG